MTTNAVGRPRDPGLDERVFSAAADLYGQRGWAGFSIEAIARTAGVGKASIYLRWPDKASLLIDALKSQLGAPEFLDTGSVRTDLAELALHDLRIYQSRFGDAALRMMAEARVVPEIAKHWESTRAVYVLAVRKIVRRAIRRKDLPESTSVTLLLDALFGAVLMHTLATPASGPPVSVGRMTAYANDIVDFVLAAVHAAVDDSDPPR